MLNCVTTETVQITPALAAKWLQQRGHNRPICTANVNRLADEIEKGDWCLNGEPIIFADTGLLLDGQHRLSAVIKAKQSITCLVVSGVQEQAWGSINSGMKRTAGHVLGANGEKSASMLAASLSWVVKYDDGNITRGRGVTSLDILRALDRHPEIRDSIVFARLAEKVLYPGLGTYCHWRMARIDADAAAEFFHKLSTGSNLAPKHPVLLLRDRLREMRSFRYRTATIDILCLVTRAWNAYINGKHELRFLRVHQPGEPFPDFLSVGKY